MNIEDEEAIKDEVSEAEAAVAELYNPYHEACERLYKAHQRLEEWMQIYG